MLVYAIIQDGGRQYRVQEGQVLDVDLRKMPEDTETVEFNEVLLLGAGADAKVGTPLVKGAKVVAKIQGEVQGPKIENIHFIRRKGHLTHTGHRQPYLRVKIEQIIG